MILYTVGIIILVYKNFAKLLFNLAKAILGRTPFCFLTSSYLSFLGVIFYLKTMFDISQKFRVLREKNLTHVDRNAGKRAL